MFRITFITLNYIDIRMVNFRKHNLFSPSLAQKDTGESDILGFSVSFGD
jgi:hypothetical protein